MQPPKTFEELFACWERPTDLVNALNKVVGFGGHYTRQRINGWKTSGCVPVSCFRDFVAAAKISKVPGVTFETLHKMMEKRND